MNGPAWHDFFTMGGYAAYVWPAYAVFLVVLLADALVPVVRRRRIVRDLRAQFARQAARQASSAALMDKARIPQVPPESA